MNIIVFYDGGYMNGKSEIHNALVKAGDQKAEMELLAPGIIGVETEANSREVISNLQEAVMANPDSLSYTLKWVPVDYWCNADEVEKVIKEDIKPVVGDVLYRVEVYVHEGGKKPAPLKKAIQESIKGRLNDDYPQKIVRG